MLMHRVGGTYGGGWVAGGGGGEDVVPADFPGLLPLPGLECETSALTLPAASSLEIFHLSDLPCMTAT